MNVHTKTYDHITLLRDLLREAKLIKNPLLRFELADDHLTVTGPEWLMDMYEGWPAASKAHIWLWLRQRYAWELEYGEGWDPTMNEDPVPELRYIPGETTPFVHRQPLTSRERMVKAFARLHTMSVCFPSKASIMCVVTS